jgi:hypothetical protein
LDHTASTSYEASLKELAQVHVILDTVANLCQDLYQCLFDMVVRSAFGRSDHHPPAIICEKRLLDRAPAAFTFAAPLADDVGNLPVCQFLGASHGSQTLLYFFVGDFRYFVGAASRDLSGVNPLPNGSRQFQ